AVHKNLCSHCHTAPPAIEDPVNRPQVTAIVRGGACADCHTTYFDSHSHNHTVTVIATALCVTCHSGDRITAVHASCASCHDPANGLRRVGVGGYGDATVNGGMGGTCVQCHSAYFNAHSHSHSASVRVNVASTPITVNCLGCHSAAITPFIGSGQVHVVNGCLTCHSAATGVRIGAATTGSGECKDCHIGAFAGHDHGSTGGGIDHTVQVNLTTDLGQTDAKPCSNCHSSQNWPNILNSHLNICTTCHNSTRDINPAAPTGITVQMVIMNANQAAVNCLACHLDKQAPAAHGSVDHSAAGLDIVLDDPACVTLCHVANSPMAVHTNRCTNCHTAPPALEDPANRLNTTYIIKGATCSGCHTLYFNKHIHSHVTTVLTTASCVTCHTGDRVTSVHTSCASCHDPANGSRRVGINGLGDATVNGGSGGTCIQCHAAYFNAHSHSHAATVAVNIASSPKTANCVICHSATISPFTVGGDVHSIGGCQTCHAPATGARIGSALNGTGECKNCHTVYFAGHDHG
ncbi:MAG: hypothetical protein Q8J76_04430, partial [Desulfobulbaceae bacterium]|nr:hypothetical protein [Desulfobulbaceae bacterium]